MNESCRLSEEIDTEKCFNFILRIPILQFSTFQKANALILISLFLSISSFSFYFLLIFPFLPYSSFHLSIPSLSISLHSPHFPNVLAISSSLSAVPGGQSKE